MPANTPIPAPPRRTGNHELDLENLHNWATDFHTAAVIDAKLLDPFHQATPDPINQQALPDPTSTSIANAQQIANAAYKKAFGL